MGSVLTLALLLVDMTDTWYLLSQSVRLCCCAWQVRKGVECGALLTQEWHLLTRNVDSVV